MINKFSCGMSSSLISNICDCLFVEVFVMNRFSCGISSSLVTSNVCDCLVVGVFDMNKLCCGISIVSSNCFLMDMMYIYYICIFIPIRIMIGT